MHSHKLSKFKGDLSDYLLWKFKLGMVLLQQKLQHTIIPKANIALTLLYDAWDAD
jgi:gag-polypeptide of LTR copia-type